MRQGEKIYRKVQLRIIIFFLFNGHNTKGHVCSFKKNLDYVRVGFFLDVNVDRCWPLLTAVDRCWPLLTAVPNINTQHVVMSWDCGLRYVFMPPMLQLGGVCALRAGGGSGGGGLAHEELTSRLGLEAVQRLAKDGCRLLQNHNYRLQDRNQAVSITVVVQYWDQGLDL